MTDLRRLAAGVICTGFKGLRVSRDLESRLRDLPVAGLILFGRNVESLAQARALTDGIRATLGAPIIAIDQEGGRVARIRDSVEELPSMMALGAIGDAELADHAGTQLASDLRRAGVNLDFAPVLDLALHRTNTVIGTRSFGDDPQRVSELAGAFARGLQAAGVVPTYKHFPGHGSTAIDSHVDLPVIDIDLATLRSRDLVPFAQLLPAAPAVMTAHVVVRALDPDRPATISPRILTGLLREELHFSGVCFTDCLQMDAIAKGVGSERAAVEALVAGADCLLISDDLDLAERAAQAVTSAVEEGALPRERLEEAHERVLRLRRGLQPPLPIDAEAPFPGIGREIGVRAVTVLRGNPQADPNQSIMIRFQITDSGVVQTPDPIPPGAKRPIVLLQRAHLYPAQAQAAHRILSEYPDAIVVSTREPFDAFDFPEAATVLCTYGDDAPSLAGLNDVLFGRAPAHGTYPLHGDPIARG